MQVQIETHSVELPAHSRKTLSNRVQKSLRQVADAVSSLHLTLREVSGRKGGREKVCTIRATLADGGEVVVIDRKDKMRQSMGGALRRFRRVVQLERNKRRSKRRRLNLKREVMA